MKLLTLLNEKTPKGEELGYLTAVLYLLPHTLGGGKTLCPHSTPGCRAMCLSGTGRAALPRQQGAKARRTKMLLDDPDGFVELLKADIRKLMHYAEINGLRPAVRLNGTSDILWERYDIMRHFPDVIFYDYTKVPLALRPGLPPNYRLTYSVSRDRIDLANAYRSAGHSLAVVVPGERKAQIMAADPRALDGDEHDLRFLDAPGSLVLLRVKGSVETDLVIPDILRRLAVKEGSRPVTAKASVKAA